MALKNRYSISAEKVAAERLGENAYLLEKHRCIDPTSAKRMRDKHNNAKYPSETWFLKELKQRGFRKPRRNKLLANNRFFGDFVWNNERLVVEIDGSSHDCEMQRAHDETRDKVIAAFGYSVFRIRHRDFSKVLEFLESYGEKLKSEDKSKTQSWSREVLSGVNLESLETKKQRDLREKERLLLKTKVRRIINQARIYNSPVWLEKQLLKLKLTVEEARKIYF